METNVNYTLVGAFVIALIAAIVVIVVWLSSGLTGQSYQFYRVYMQEPVTGLNVSAPVEFNGVNVGSVSSIQINPKNPQSVELLLKVKKDTPITIGTRAKLDLRSLSGTTYMQLIDKGTDMKPLTLAKGQDYPVILTTPSILLRFSTALTEITSSFKQFSTSLQQLLDKENLKSIKESLINIRKFSATLSKDSGDIDALLINMSKASRSLKIETIPAANRALTNFGNFTQNISGISGEIKQNPAVIIRGRAQQPLGPGER